VLPPLVLLCEAGRAPQLCHLNHLPACLPVCLSAFKVATRPAVCLCLCLCIPPCRPHDQHCIIITTPPRCCRFLRPLYRALHSSKSAAARDAALSTFQENRLQYHPIASKMVAADLKLGSKEEEEDA
jgi:hypothetical protein